MQRPWKPKWWKMIQLYWHSHISEVIFVDWQVLQHHNCCTTLRHMLVAPYSTFWHIPVHVTGWQVVQALLSYNFSLKYKETKAQNPEAFMNLSSTEIKVGRSVCSELHTLSHLIYTNKKTCGSIGNWKEYVRIRFLSLIYSDLKNT